MYPRSGHAMSVDVDRDELNPRIAAWFERHTGDATVARTG
jgi:hypothetical protein